MTADSSSISSIRVVSGFGDPGCYAQNLDEEAEPVNLVWVMGWQVWEEGDDDWQCVETLTGHTSTVRRISRSVSFSRDCLLL